MLTPDEAALLKRIARESVRATAEGRDAAASPPPSGALALQGAAFVTLKRNGDLRGCIGQIQASQALWAGVREMAAEAAADPRFPAVTPGEVDALAIEITVLSPMARVADPAEILVGRDGLYIRRGYQTGILLPQVATEWKWDRDMFLAQTCVKAGLPAGAWKERDVQLFKFTAEIY